jgi:hypothetical protein
MYIYIYIHTYINVVCVCVVCVDEHRWNMRVRCGRVCAVSGSAGTDVDERMTSEDNMMNRCT